MSCETNPRRCERICPLAARLDAEFHFDIQRYFLFPPHYLGKVVVEFLANHRYLPVHIIHPPEGAVCTCGLLKSIQDSVTMKKTCGGVSRCPYFLGDQGTPVQYQVNYLGREHPKKQNWKRKELVRRSNEVTIFPNFITL